MQFPTFTGVWKYCSIWCNLICNFSITHGKSDLFQFFVIPAKAEIQNDFDLLLDSGFRRNDVITQNFLRKDSDFDTSGFGHWILEFEIYLEFGAWNLFFDIWKNGIVVYTKKTSFRSIHYSNIPLFQLGRSP